MIFFSDVRLLRLLGQLPSQITNLLVRSSELPLQVLDYLHEVHVDRLVLKLRFGIRSLEELIPPDPSLIPEPLNLHTREC